jgi:hypothetical protein
MMQWVQSHGYDEFTLENLELAYRELSSQGKLIEKGTAAAQPATPTSTHRSSRSSSVSTNRSSTPVVKTETEEDLYKMDMTELRRKADSQLQKQAADRDGSSLWQ